MIELLAPAGDLEKCKIALLYGADAVYLGGKKFSLRAAASNFSLEDIQEACVFAKKLNKRIHVTMNIIPHDEDFTGLDEYIKDLAQAGVSACIVASPYIAKRIKELSNMEVHLSTQFSVTNTQAVKFYEENGYDRVVLGREVTLEEMHKICQNAKIDMEAFIHGGMCVSYSGRCTLSNNLTDRDANRGGCAHSCRWNYRLYHEDVLETSKYFSMSSKDLNAIEFVPSLIDMGVKSLKIEGRMKSIHYIATVVRSYRMLIDDYYNNALRDLSFYNKEVQKAENRLTSVGFYKGEPTLEEQLYDNRSENPTQTFCFYVKDYQNGYIIGEERNRFKVNDFLEVICPNGNSFNFKVEEILDEKGSLIEVARHPREILKIKCSKEVPKYSMMRIIK